MMDAKRHVILLLATFSVSTQAHAQVTAAIVKLNGSGAHFLYTPKKLSSGDKVVLQFPKNDQPACCASIDWKTATLLSSDPDAVELNLSRPLFRYRFSAKGVTAPMPFVGLAAVGTTAIQADGPWRMKTLGAKTSTDLALCTSQEGVHVQSRSAGKIQNHLYLYLGYDLENPSCDKDGTLR